MEDERRRKIDAGKEKLAAYRKRKSGDSEPSSLTFSDTSLSLSPLPLSETGTNTALPAVVGQRHSHSAGSSSISENIVEVSNSEQDRSLQEMVVASIPLDDATDSGAPAAVNDSVASDSSVVSPNALEQCALDGNTVLNELIGQEGFSGTSANLDSLRSNPVDDSGSLTLRSECAGGCAADAGTGAGAAVPAGADAAGGPEHRPPLPDGDSLREVNSSDPSTVSLGTSTTEYKQYFNKINLGAIEFQDLLAHRDDHIKQLTDALQQVLEDRNGLQEQADHFAQEIADLREQLVHTTAIIKQNHHWSTSLQEPSNESVGSDLDWAGLGDTLTADEQRILADARTKISRFVQQKLAAGASVYEAEIRALKQRAAASAGDSDDVEFDETFSAEERATMADLRAKIYGFIRHRVEAHRVEQDLELKVLRDRYESEKTTHHTEVERLRQLVAHVKSGSLEVTALRDELHVQHGREMEELRTYFEQRCADMEKHYSEEIFSQHSRKLSGSSLGSELDSDCLPASTAAAGAGGDDGQTTDLHAVRLELQNKYHAELEILREDYETRLDELRIAHGNVVRDVEDRYVGRIDLLRAELEDVHRNVAAAATQEVASSGDFEIAEVVQSYERRLQEQVLLAKTDIISALEQQIQAVVAAQPGDLECPSLLVALGERLTEPKIRELAVAHEQEIARLQEDHEKSLARALDRERRHSLRTGEDGDLRRERDKLRKLTGRLQHLVGELIKYFTKCEDELNATLVEELLRHGFDRTAPSTEESFESSPASEHPDPLAVSPRVKRVHFTPDVSAIIGLINDSSLDVLDRDVSTEFRTELDLCLERLKSEANAILGLTLNMKARSITGADDGEDHPRPMIEDKLCSLTRHLVAETQAKNELNAQLADSRAHVLSLEADRHGLDAQLEQLAAKQHVLVAELDQARAKIAELVESGRKEIVSEGYGENQIMGSTALGGRIASLAELQDRARALLADSDASAEQPQHPLVQLLAELCREADRIMEDAKRDHEDLVQQIEAADKKLRATTQFLEEQAVERELERDEAQREVAGLREQLRDSERTRLSCEQINKEVERLEVQMREMTMLMADCEAKKVDVESELKEAIDKIWVLRDIIRDLEAQVDGKADTEAELKRIVAQLEQKAAEEARASDELRTQLQQCPEEGHYTEIVRRLEAEIQRLRVSSELVGPDGVLQQVKTQLTEFERSVEKRTKDLEALHTVVSNTNCSSPSEDMSIRDQIRPSAGATDGDSDLPLEQLARLKDKLLRHARAEDAAMKHIRDLEMQVYTCKQDYEEIQSERDVLQDQLSEQMAVISSLQLRLDEQRLRVESVQKQTNTSLEHKIYELETEAQQLKEAVHSRDKQVKQLTTVVDQTKQRLADQQKQLNSAADIEKEIVAQLQTEIGRLKAENEDLRVRSEVPGNEHVSAGGVSPAFLDTMLMDKNADIDRLKARLTEAEQQLQVYASLSAGQAPDFTSTVAETSVPEPMRRQATSPDETLHSTGPVDNFQRAINETVFIGSTFRDADQAVHRPFVVAPELSSIERVDLSVAGDSLKSDKRVHFEDNTLALADLEAKVARLQLDLEAKNDAVRSYEQQLADHSAGDLDKLRRRLEFSEETLRETTDSFKEDLEAMRVAEQDLRVQLAQAKVDVHQRTTKLEALEQEVARREQMYVNLAREKRDLEARIGELEARHAEVARVDRVLEQKNKEIYALERQLAETGSSESLRDSVMQKESEIGGLREELSNLEFRLAEATVQADKVQVGYEEARHALSEHEALLAAAHKNEASVRAHCDELTAQAGQLQAQLDERTSRVEQLEAEVKQDRDQSAKLQHEIRQLEARLGQVQADDAQKLSLSAVELELVRHKKELAEKELQLTQQRVAADELHKEVHHLQEFLGEKDKIIHQMTVDSASLHVALEAIQSKMQESGNVVDLKKRLRDEQRLAGALHEELKCLKQSVESGGAVAEQLALLTETVARERATSEELASARDALLLETNELKRRLAHADTVVQQLRTALSDEKHNSNEVQLQDAHIIESMRVRLEALLDHEHDAEQRLKDEKRARALVERQLSALSRDPTAESPGGGGTLTGANFDAACLQMDLVRVGTENEMLRAEMDTLRQGHAALQAELAQSKGAHSVQAAEIQGLRDGLQEQHRVEQRSLEADSAAHQAQAENAQMREQLEALGDRLRHVQASEAELSQLLALERHRQLEAPVPEKFLQKMKELTALLQGHIADNKQMTGTVVQLTDERRALQQRVRELEDRLNIKPPYDDPVSRADHLFGRYLKSESYRKALVFQKRYLLTLLASYQRCSSVNLAELNFVLPSLHHSRGLNKFRIAVYAIISIHRMQYIVQRWHTGKRIGASVVLKRPMTSPVVIRSAVSVGAVVTSPARPLPWSGNSPPCKERRNARTELPLGNSIQESLTLAPLQTPGILSQYIERLDNIHTRLGLAASDRGSTAS